jgi:hypothetical protein
LKYTDLIVLSYRSTLNKVGEDGKIVPNDKDDVSRVKYISQGFEIDLTKGLYKTIFGPAGTQWIDMVNGWYKIGSSIVLLDGFRSTDGLIGVYNKNNFQHLSNMIYNAIEANTDRSNED